MLAEMVFLPEFTKIAFLYAFINNNNVHLHGALFKIICSENFTSKKTANRPILNKLSC